MLYTYIMLHPQRHRTQYMRITTLEKRTPVDHWQDVRMAGEWSHLSERATVYPSDLPTSLRTAQQRSSEGAFQDPFGGHVPLH